jgi:ADP-dependent phosphofructokinase/glucokinase
MGRILFDLGLKPLVSYPCRPKELMLASPNFKVVSGNKVVLPKEAIREKDPAYDHIIFQFKNNRQIFSWDLMSSHGIFDYDFLNFACNQKFTDILLLGFAHLILPKYKRRINEIVDFLKEKRPKVHLEFGLGCEESMKYAIKKFTEYNCVDSFGLDENECKTYLNAKSKTKDELINSALNTIKKYDLKRICVHTLNFAFSISKNPMEKEFESLATACLVASAQTFGKLDFKRAKALSPSTSPIKKRIDGYNFCIVPTLINPNPKILTGIGDAFAAVQAVKALSQK